MATRGVPLVAACSSEAVFATSTCVRIVGVQDCGAKRGLALARGLVHLWRPGTAPVLQATRVPSDCAPGAT